MEMAVKFDRESAKNGRPVERVTVGQVNKEGTFRFAPGESSADREVREFFSIAEVSTAVDSLGRLRSVSDRFYQELGTNPSISTYGQVGAYESTYKSYKYGGFIYRLDANDIVRTRGYRFHIRSVSSDRVGVFPPVTFADP